MQKYTKYTNEMLQNILSEGSLYDDGKQWMCKTCDGALIMGNIPAQAKANGLKLPPIPPELSCIRSKTHFTACAIHEDGGPSLREAALHPWPSC